MAGSVAPVLVFATAIFDVLPGGVLLGAISDLASVAFGTRPLALVQPMPVGSHVEFLPWFCKCLQLRAVLGLLVEVLGTLDISHLVVFEESFCDILLPTLSRQVQRVSEQGHPVHQRTYWVHLVVLAAKHRRIEPRTDSEKRIPGARILP